jgi:hypothetical protein
MQPTYLPWSGYFALMQSVDLFIYLDTVQFARRSWQQRNQIKTPAGAQWLTVPVRTKGKRDQAIADVEIEGDFSSRHRKTIESSYRKAPFFDAALLPELPPAGLCDLNVTLIERIKVRLGIATPTMRASELNGSGTRADLLASLCREVGGTEYVSPPGSRAYLDASDAFERCGIPVRYFEFQHPEYPQLHGDFLPYMSCVDMLFCCGENSRDLIAGGCYWN